MSFGVQDVSEAGRSASDQLHEPAAHPVGSSPLRLLNSEQAARVLGVHRSTLNRLVQAGQLPVVTYSDAPGASQFFLEDDLAAFVRSRRSTRRRPSPVKRKRARSVDAASPWKVKR